MKYIVPFLKWCIGIGLVTWLIIHIDWIDVWRILRGVDLRWIALYACIIVVGNFISVWRWQHLAQAHGLRERATTLFALYVTASFINNFLPGFVGGDTYRAYHLGHVRGRMLPATFSVIVDRVVGLFGILVLASALVVLWQIVPHFAPIARNRDVLTLVMVLTIFLTFFVWVCMVWRYEIITFLAQFLPKKYTHYAEYTRDYTARILLHSTMRGTLFGLIGVGLANYILFLALGTVLPFTHFLFFALLASIISSVPLSIGNIGIKEWAYIALFGIIGVDPSVAIASVLIGRVTQALISTIGVPFYFMRERIHKRAVGKD